MGETPRTRRMLAATVALAIAALWGCDGSSEPDDGRAAGGARSSDRADARAADRIRPGQACDREVGARTEVPEGAGKVLTGGFANLVAVGAGRVWVPVAPPGATSPGRVELLAVDVASGGVRRYRLRASGEVRIRVAGGVVWLADPQTSSVTRLEIESGRRVTRFFLGRPPREIAADEDGAWLVPATGGTVLELDPRTARLRHRVRLDAQELGDVALDARHAWFSTTDGEVLRVERRTRRPLGEPVRVGATALDIEVGEGQVWVDLGDEDRLAHLDADSGRLLGHAPSGGDVFAIAVGLGSVWATNYVRATVTRLDAETGARIGEPLRTGSDPKGIAVGEGAVWVADAGDCTVTKLVP